MQEADDYRKDVEKNYPPPFAATWLNIRANPSELKVDDYIANLGGKWIPKSIPNLTRPNHDYVVSCHHAEVSTILHYTPSQQKSVNCLSD